MPAVSPSDLSGLFKEVYADDLQNLIPENALFTRRVPFVEADKELGNKYHQPVALTMPQGVTYAAFNAGAFSLKQARPMKTQDAQVVGSQLLVREQIAYDVAARSTTNKKAFEKATRLIVEYMRMSAFRRLECMNFYGQSTTGLGTISAIATVNATTRTITLTAAQWATGIWIGMQGATLNLINSTDSVWAGSNTALTGNPTADDLFTISTIDVANKQLTITGTAAGCTQLSTFIGAGKTVYIVFEDAFGNTTDGPKEAAGIERQLTNTGTLFNIDAATYDLWRGNVFTTGAGPLTMARVLLGTSQAIQRGLDENAVVWVNPDTWTNLVSDLAAQRRFDGSYNRKKMDNGAESIEFYHHNGVLSLVSHNVVKEGDCFIVPDSKRKLTRIGAQELSFNTPGRGDEIFFQLTENAGFELRCYTDQAPFLSTPARATKITGFTNIVS